MPRLLLGVLLCLGLGLGATACSEKGCKRKCTLTIIKADDRDKRFEGSCSSKKSEEMTCQCAIENACKAAGEGPDCVRSGKYNTGSGRETEETCVK